jgi:hypothetical protein
MRVEPDDESGDTEGPDTARLGVPLEVMSDASTQVSAKAYLLDAGDVTSDILHSDRVLDGQAVALALYPSLVDEHTTVRSQT